MSETYKDRVDSKIYGARLIIYRRGDVENASSNRFLPCRILLILRIIRLYMVKNSLTTQKDTERDGLHCSR